jgi:DNA-binding response OmpR family regulator
MVRPQARVLVVEPSLDQEPENRSLADALVQHGYDVRISHDGRVEPGAADFAPEVLVIDLRGGDPVATIRDVVRLVAPHGVADEYEPVAVRARRLLADFGREAPHLRYGDIDVDFEQLSTTVRGQDVPLTATELYLLVALLRDPHAIVRKAQMLRDLWGPSATNPNVVEAHISALRRKLEGTGVSPILTVRGLGYQLARR